MEQPTIRISEVIAAIGSGVTRKDNDPGFVPALGSIQSKYTLTPTQVGILFTHPKLKGLKVKKANTLNIVDDTVEGFVEPTVTMMPPIGAVQDNTIQQLEETEAPIEDLPQTNTPMPAFVPVEAELDELGF